MPLKGARKRRYQRAYMAERRHKQRKAHKAASRSNPSIPCPPWPSDPARELAEWCASTLKVPPGHPKAGEPMSMPGFGQRFFADALRPEISESLLCVARKNGKSALVAEYLLARLCGPLRTAGYRAGVVSVSREKASELWLQSRDIADASGLEKEVRFQKVPRLILSATGRCEILSSDRSAGHASGFDDSILDELGLFPERARELVAGMRSAVSAREGRLWALSIHGDGPFVPEILQRKSDSATAVHIYQAQTDCALDDRKAWAASNPGLGTIKSERYMADSARRAILAPADQAAFRAYDLNAPLDPARALICSVSDWKAVETDTLPARKGPCFLGLDLGGSVSLSAVAALWPKTGRMELWAALPDVPALKVRSVADGVGGLYERACERGELRLFPGRVTDVGMFLNGVAAELSGCRIARAGCDRYRKAEALQALEGAKVRWPITWRGTGASKTADGSHDVRSFQRRVLSGNLRVRSNLLACGRLSAIRLSGSTARAIRRSPSTSRPGG